MSLAEDVARIGRIPVARVEEIHRNAAAEQSKLNQSHQPTPKGQ